MRPTAGGDGSPGGGRDASADDPTLTFLLLLLLAYAKKEKIFVLFNLFSQFGFKLFLSFFYRVFSLPLALDNACRTNYGGRRRLPPDVGRRN